MINTWGNTSLRLLMNLISRIISTISENIYKVKNTFMINWRQVIFFVIKFLQINVLLNIINFDLINKFSLLTSFHGYNENLYKEEKIA